MAHKPPGQTPSRRLTFFFGHGLATVLSLPRCARYLSASPSCTPIPSSRTTREDAPERGLQRERGL